MKIATILGTRPEIIKLSQVIKVFESNTDHFIINTNQNFNSKLNKNFFSELGIKSPKYNLNCSDITFAKTLSNIISKVDDMLAQKEKDILSV